MNNCPCQELENHKRQIAEMQAEMAMLSRRNIVCNTVVYPMYRENKELKAENERLKKQVENSTKVVRCAVCKHRMRDEHAENVHYICKHPRGLSRINKDCFCSFGEVDNG